MILRSTLLSLVLTAVAAAQSTTPAPAAADLPDAPSTTGQVKTPAMPTGPTAVIDTSM
ncbi:MAG TPA: hypothetical protein VGC07_09355 [Granulicella sp.]